MLTISHRDLLFRTVPAEQLEGHYIHSLNIAGKFQGFEVYGHPNKSGTTSVIHFGDKLCGHPGIVTISAFSGTMLSTVKSVAKRSVSIRAFSSIVRDVPNSIEQITVGRQGEELKLAEEGVELFNRDPIASEESQGNSKDDPILVPSWNSTRAVGISHNDSPYIVWFNLEEGKVHHVPRFNKYFKLDNKNPNAGHHHH
ncbi:hypothetical protein DYB30_002629 [Aphanomyces astaci]|nr:hypothetical protein DYB36_003141 [Aphanomyces astaci]RHY42694.1 hypothetical protein DYB30_002629 [Aphanomyces astaci]RHZ30703.1 hypothetical protein DYB31_003987 [Aphanomyces astaci]